MIAWGGTPIGAALGGLVSDAHGVTAAYTMLAVPTGLALVALLLSPVRWLR